MIDNVKNVVIESGGEDGFSVELDTEITLELKLEGISRNLIRHMNNYRKQLKLSTKDRINLYLETKDEEIIECIERHKEKIKKMIQADTIIQNLEGKQDIKKLKIENKVVEVYIEVK